MRHFPIFLSVVFVLRNQSESIEEILTDATATVAPLANDYELIVIDNASEDNSVAILQELTGEGRLPNLQAYVLAKEVDMATAAWAGIENALGDFICAIDPLADDIGFLPLMLEKAVGGIDLVFANNEKKQRGTFAYRMATAIFNGLYRCLHGINADKDAPHYRLLSRRVATFILQYTQPSVAYRNLPVIGGFTRTNLSYNSTPRGRRAKKLPESIDRGIRLLTTATKAPMRLVTSLSLFGSIANLCYSLYVVAIWLFKEDVEAGWASISLQQSGMFFLFSLVLLILGEYILHIESLSSRGPLYHLAQEFSSAALTRKEKLNVEEVINRRQSPSQE